MQTKNNPADDITRGLRPTELNIGHRYNDGPGFLYESAELWPENKVEVPQEKDDESEKKKERWAGIIPSETKKSYSVCNAVHKQHKSEGARASDGATYIDRAQICSELSSEEGAICVVR